MATRYYEGHCPDSVVYIIRKGGEALPQPSTYSSCVPIVEAPTYLVEADEFKWENGDTTHTISATHGSGYYSFSYRNGACIFKDSILAAIVDTASILSVTDTVLCWGDTLQLTLNEDVKGALWRGSDTGNSYTVTGEEQSISLSYISPCGEISKFFTIQRIGCDCKLYVPNSFTPDKASPTLNDNFSGLTDCTILSSETHIYNRWGELIYSGTAWNGTYKGEPAQEGMYLYHMRYEVRDGASSKWIQKIGTVTLLR